MRAIKRMLCMWIIKMTIIKIRIIEMTITMRSAEGMVDSHA